MMVTDRFPVVWRTSRRNFQNFRKVPESIKMKQTKNGKFPYHYFLVTEICTPALLEAMEKYSRSVNPRISNLGAAFLHQFRTMNEVPSKEEEKNIPDLPKEAKEQFS